MNTKKWICTALSLLLVAAGIIMVVLFRSAAIMEDAALADKFPFTVGLILIIAGVVALIAGLMPAQHSTNIRTLTMAAMFAALCYVGFAFFKIDIPVGNDSTAFHLGNVFCVLAALCIGGLWGGLAGAVGMTIGDLFNPLYITSAPKTFLLKLGIGLISGFVAHKIFHLSRDRQRKVPLPIATVLSCCAGMVFNIIADPLVGYFYKMYVMGIPQDAAKLLAKINSLTTCVNAVIAVIAATVFYLALRPALRRMKMLPEL